MEGDLHKLDPI
jgi:hypothetical protein